MESFKHVVSGIVAVVVAILLFAFWPLVSIPAGHKGVVTIFGEVKEGALSPGLNFVNPMAHVIDVNTQVQKIEVEGAASSKDLQQIHTKIAVNYHLAQDSVQRLFSDVGMQYESKFINPAVQEAFKAVSAKYSATELIEKRGDVKALIQTALAEAVE